MRSPARRVLSAALLLGLPFSLGAQASGDVVVRVQVVDSVNVAVSGADVSIFEGLTDVRARGVTDDHGRTTLIIKRDDSQRELIARKIGFARASMFFRPQRDTIGVRVVMHRPAQQLEAVKVTEREDAKRKSYHVDADEIAASTRPILDGM